MYFIFRPDLTASSPGGGNESINLLLLTPFLAGFSTKLVFGILNQAVKAVEIAIGIDSRDKDLHQRRKK